MSGVEFVDEAAGKDALKSVRNDKSEIDWCLFTYEDAKSSKVALKGTGSGGIEELKTHLGNDVIGYGLVRKTDKIDDSVTVKFVYIFWLGDDAPRMQKARVSTHQGAVRNFIGQFHVDITTSDISELSDEALQAKVMDNSGSASKVIDKNTGAREVRSGTGSGSGSKIASKNTGLTFTDEANLKEKLREIRVATGEGSNDWFLIGYEGESENLVLLGTGSGGASELVSLLSDDMAAYGLVRRVEQIDDTKATKFAFIKFQGDHMPRMLKARIGTHAGKVQEFFQPYHVSIDATQKSEITDEIIMKTIQTASGTRVHVLDDQRTAAQPPVAQQTQIRTGGSGLQPKTATVTKAVAVPRGNEQNVKFSDEDAIRNSIKEVRNDTVDTDWCLVGYEGKKGNVLVLLGKGSGGLSELVGLLEDDMVGYGLLRKTEKFDESLTVKFVHIVFTGENINRMHRARLGTHKGEVNQLFSPYHVDFQATSTSELTDEVLQTRIGEASGTANKVK